MNRTLILSGVLALVFSSGCASPPTIALLTDFGWNDPYAGAVQGAILSINPDARIITITHEAPNYDIREASYILATAAKQFPAGTIFLAVVDPGVGGSRRPVIVETLDGKFFVGPDNGIFTDVIRSLGFKRAVEINNVLWFRRGAISNTFHGRDIFAPAAARLSQGKKITDAGPEISDPVLLGRAPAELTERGITGEMIHNDHYGNLITNIPAPHLAKSGWRAGMDLEFSVREQTVSAKFVERFNSVPQGEFLLIINGQGLLELARNMASAADSLKASAGDSVLVRTAGTDTLMPSPMSAQQVSERVLAPAR